MKFIATPDSLSRVPVKFPALMESTGGTPTVVLFTDEGRGYRLGNEGFGHIEGGWLSASNPAHWRPFVGTIKVEA
jgi:hypothetical protein